MIQSEPGNIPLLNRLGGWLVLAAALGMVLYLASAWPNLAAGQTWQRKIPAFDNVTDDGEGSIRVAWSWQALSPGEAHEDGNPDKICVSWKAGDAGTATETCFTSEVGTESDLVVDTGDYTPGTVYTVYLYVYYGGLQLYARNSSDGIASEQVTLN